MSRRATPLTDGEVVAIFRSTIPLKIVAAQFDVSLAMASYIRRGKKRASITEPYAIAARMNASLITIAFNPEALT